MNTKFLLSLSLLLAGGQSAWADSSVALNFSAQENPSACQITAGTKTTIDYGTLSRSTLSVSSAHQLADQAMVALSVQCESPTSIGLRATDNRSGALAYGDLVLANGAVLSAEKTDQRFSLGLTTDNRPVGVWGLVFNGAAVDGSPVGIYSRSSAGLLTADAVMRKDGALTTWATGAGAPAIGRLFSIGGVVSAALARLSDLPSKEVQLDGLVTLEVVYL
jgi:type 1 fimbria pilin